MKKLLILCVLLMFAACGGATTDTTPDPSPDIITPDLPDIIDNQADELFKYSDPSLYIGDYILSNGHPDTCSSFFNATPTTQFSVLSANNDLLILYADGVQLSYPDFPQNEFDFYAYVGDYLTAICGFALCSGNEENQTYDILILECESTYSYESCSTVYIRESEYDFTGEIIN